MLLYDRLVPRACWRSDEEMLPGHCTP
jgi:hypothetical protein